MTAPARPISDHLLHSPKPNADLPWPAWVGEIFHGVHPHRISSQATAWQSSQFHLLRLRVQQADGLSPDEFQKSARQAYQAVAEHFSSSSSLHVVRLWNYIPSIHRPCGSGLSRYMIFNAGRFDGCQQWFGGEGKFADALPAASGVGHASADLVIDALATTSPGIAVENPRQAPAYRYTRRYGPRPPCFARATKLPQQRLLLVAGTASVIGEDSAHAGDLAGQLRETLANLANIVRAAIGSENSSDAKLLQRYTDLRIYYPQPAMLSAIATTVQDAFSPHARLEFRQADLCREELLVEIEGIARCD